VERREEENLKFRKWSFEENKEGRKEVQRKVQTLNSSHSRLISSSHQS
jgi:hypothetical protein